MFVHLSEDEIISSIVHQDEEALDEESEDEDSQQDQGAPRVSHNTAMKLFDQCLLWLQQQEEASLYDVGAVRELRDFAARKRTSRKNSLTISNQVTHECIM